MRSLCWVESTFWVTTAQTYKASSASAPTFRWAFIISISAIDNSYSLHKYSLILLCSSRFWSPSVLSWRVWFLRTSTGSTNKKSLTAGSYWSYSLQPGSLPFLFLPNVNKTYNYCLNINETVTHCNMTKTVCRKVKVTCKQCQTPMQNWESWECSYSCNDLNYLNIFLSSSQLL